MPRIKAVILVLIASCFCVQNRLEAWDNTRTHRDLSEMAARKSILGSQEYLKQIGFSKGLDEKIRGKEVFMWIRDGSFYEDAGGLSDTIANRARFNNHFHDPLKLWSGAGLDDTLTIPIPIPPYRWPYDVYGESALRWAQDSRGQATFPEREDWSWRAIRDYYYKALAAGTDMERQENFARTFRGLGHQMHLMQDMSQPSHVRNDAHPEDSLLGENYITGSPYFETWAKRHPDIINSFASEPVFAEVPLNINREGLVPITQFIDSDQYDGTNPSTSLEWGMSEYTSANFVSDDTIFTDTIAYDDRHYFPYPRYGTQCYDLFEAEDISTQKKRTYMTKTCEGEYVKRFLTVGPLFKYLGFNWDLQRSTLKFDSNTHTDCAEKLIPRAVGYSAGLLNYFFRGDIDMVPEGAIGWENIIVNNSDEDMEGIFELWYDTKNETRSKVWFGYMSLKNKSSGFNKSGRIVFSAPADAKKPGDYVLVFKGTMGNEQDAVAGKTVKISQLPRAGVIDVSGASPRTVALIRILEKDQIKYYSVNIASPENILKAAFDEGRLDTVRVLTLQGSSVTPPLIWKLYVFKYSEIDKVYKMQSVEEVDRFEPPAPIKSDFTYSLTDTQSVPFQRTLTRTYNGHVIEQNFTDPLIQDFFAGEGSQIKFLKSERESFRLDVVNMRYEWKEEGSWVDSYSGKKCSSSGAGLEECLSQCDNNYPGTCSESGASSHTTGCAGSDFSYENTGNCSELEIFNVGRTGGISECDGIGSIHNGDDIWENVTLSYSGFIKTIENGDYQGQTWTIGDKGVCIPFSSDAAKWYGLFQGKIVSNNQLILSTDHRKNNVVVEQDVEIEPDGIKLSSMNALVLRQTGGYSFLEITGSKTARSHTSIVQVPSDKPIVLNRERNGLRLSYDGTTGKVGITVGIEYNESRQNFARENNAYPFSAPIVNISDIMVEYVKK